MKIAVKGTSVEDWRRWTNPAAKSQPISKLEMRVKSHRERVERGTCPMHNHCWVVVTSL